MLFHRHFRRWLMFVARIHFWVELEQPVHGLAVLAVPLDIFVRNLHLRQGLLRRVPPLSKEYGSSKAENSNGCRPTHSNTCNSSFRDSLMGRCWRGIEEFLIGVLPRLGAPEVGVDIGFAPSHVRGLIATGL